MSLPIDDELYWQHLRFEIECLRRVGSEFQSFFEAVMLKHDGSFQTVKPWGREGDRKCDGVSVASGTLFQVYAPEVLTAAETVAKIDEDFSGARKHWDRFANWVFVWSSVDAGLPPAVVKKLADMRADPDNAHIGIDDWSRENLWNLVKALSPQQRAELLGVVPVPTATTTAEIRTLLNWLVESGADGITPAEGFEHTDIADKITINGLSDRVSGLIARAMPVVGEVEQYVSNSYDGDFSAKVAAILIARYKRAEILGTDPDQIFVGLVDAVANGPDKSGAEFWGAVGIVSYYFELCDIFKKQ